MGGLSNGLGPLQFNDDRPNFWSSLQSIPKETPTVNQSKPDDTLNVNQSKPNQYDSVLQDVAATYPALALHVKKAMVYDATPSKDQTDNQLETYLPWEDWNPHPGKVTTELYRPYTSRSELRDALAGDLIHLAGAVDPKTGKPVDPTYYKLKQQVKKARSPQQIKADYRAYKESGDERSFDQWFQDSRGEAYVRGRLFPDKNDEWRSWYEENPKLKKAVDNVGKYLRTGK